MMNVCVQIFHSKTERFLDPKVFCSHTLDPIVFASHFIEKIDKHDYKEVGKGQKRAENLFIQKNVASISSRL